MTLSGKKISWQQQLADEPHKPIKRNFTRQRVIVNGIDKIWCSDLVEMQQFSKWNKGCRYQSSHGVRSILQIWLDCPIEG